MTCPSCRQPFEPKHPLRRYCYDRGCLARRNLASVKKAKSWGMVAGRAGSAKRRRQLERCGVPVEST